MKPSYTILCTQGSLENFLRLTQKIPISLSSAKVEHRDATVWKWSRARAHGTNSKVKSTRWSSRRRWISGVQSINGATPTLRVQVREWGHAASLVIYSPHPFRPRQFFFCRSSHSDSRDEKTKFKATLCVTIESIKIHNEAAVKAGPYLPSSAPPLIYFFFKRRGREGTPKGALPQNYQHSPSSVFFFHKEGGELFWRIQITAAITARISRPLGLYFFRACHCDQRT